MVIGFRLKTDISFETIYSSSMRRKWLAYYYILRDAVWRVQQTKFNRFLTPTEHKSTNHAIAKFMCLIQVNIQSEVVYVMYMSVRYYSKVPH